MPVNHLAYQFCFWKKLRKIITFLAIILHFILCISHHKDWTSEIWHTCRNSLHKFFTYFVSSSYYAVEWRMCMICATFWWRYIRCGGIRRPPCSQICYVFQFLVIDILRAKITAFKFLIPEFAANCEVPDVVLVVLFTCMFIPNYFVIILVDSSGSLLF